MTSKVMQVANMLEMLPEEEQDLAVNLLQRLVLAWDPDFTKVTSRERKELEEAEEGEFFWEDEIDWDNLGKYTE